MGTRLNKTDRLFLQPTMKLPLMTSFHNGCDDDDDDDDNDDDCDIVVTDDADDDAGNDNDYDSLRKAAKKVLNGLKENC